MIGIPNVGDLLAGKYRVEKILGIGGMGMVVAATNVDIDQHVAIKFMLPAALESVEAPRRFEREARSAGRLTSEHVCRVIDVGRFDSGAPYIVMEYLEGYDLGTLLKRRGPRPIGEAIGYILQACEGMAEAHACGIVHRDLKPDNLFLASRNDGTQVIKVLDFGISKATVTGIATKTGDLMGSPAYMAPEQIQSTKDVDQRADIWSLGVVLYQLIGGRMPFIADTLPALCMVVINDPPPPLGILRKDLPLGIAEVVARCLAKDRDKRYQTVADLARALAPYGFPGTEMSLTRIHGMLQRRRAPDAPLMMLSSEFSDVVGNVAPTLMTTSHDRLDITPVVAPPKSHVTTIGASAGESMSLLGRKIRMRSLVPVVAAVALISVVVTMAMVRTGGAPASISSGTRPATPVESSKPVEAPTKSDKVEAVEPPAKVETPAKVEAQAVVVDAPPPPPPPPPPRKIAHVVAKPPPPPSKVEEVKADKPAVTDGSASGPVDDDAQWGHMHHDQPR